MKRGYPGRVEARTTNVRAGSLVVHVNEQKAEILPIDGKRAVERDVWKTQQYPLR